MTLEEELEALKGMASKSLQNQIHGSFIDNINESGKLALVPKIGDLAPVFELPDEDQQVVNSQDLLQKGPLIISFYRGDWCAFCNLELRTLQRSLAEFKKLGASLVGISPQSVAYSHMTADRRNVQYQVLSDEGNKIANDYGLMFSMSDQAVNAYKSFGIDLAMINGSESSVDVPVPATFVVNTDGLISYRFVDADYTKRAAPADIIANLMSLNSQSF